MASTFVDRLRKFREELVADRQDALLAAMDATREQVRETHLDRAVTVQHRIAVVDEAIRDETSQHSH